MARVKYCSVPSILRDASSSCVRMMPSSSPCSGPIRFCPPSPRVSDKIRRAHVPAARQIRQHHFAVVVRMRADHQYAAQRVQAFQRLADLDFAGKHPLRGGGADKNKYGGDDQRRGG